MSANVETMFSVREVPWHGLGEIVKEAPTSEEAIKLAGLDWNVLQEPVKWKDNESGYYMNIRDKDDRVLGVVGGRYVPVQNSEAFNFMDSLIDRGLTYETAGSLATGKRVWLLAKLPSSKVLGDVVEPFMCLTNSHDGFGSLKVCMTPVRVVCQNTLNLALQGTKRVWNVRHTGNIEGKLQAAQQTLGLAHTYMNNLSVEAEELAKIKINNNRFEILVDTMFPITADMSQRKEDSQLLLRDQLQHAWNIDDLGSIRGTGWGFINAVSDMSTHKPALRGAAKENSFMAVVDAPALLDLAYNLIRTVV